MYIHICIYIYTCIYIIYTFIYLGDTAGGPRGRRDRAPLENPVARHRRYLPHVERARGHGTWGSGFFKIGYRGTALIRNRPSLGPYKRPRPRALWWS